MSRLIHTQNPHDLFTTRAEIESFFHEKIMHNTKKLIGSELELFVHDQGRPINPQEMCDLIRSIETRFPATSRIEENGTSVGLHIPYIGNISLEPGNQIEISTTPCEDLTTLIETNSFLLNTLNDVARKKNFTLTGKGHMEEFLEAPDAARSRFQAYYRYCREEHGERANDLIKTMKSVCGLQINLDPMGHDFHEVYRALMLVELAHHFKERTERQKRLHETYATLFPEQVTPLFNAVSAPNNSVLIKMIVNRFLTLKVPFLPDPTTEEGFRSTLDIFDKAPTIEKLMKGGLLTRDVLENCLSLQMTMPNLRGSGILETRAPDSTLSLYDIMMVTQLYSDVAYDAEKRRGLLGRFANIDPLKLEKAFENRFSVSQRSLYAIDIGGGETVGSLVKYVSDLSHNKKPQRGRVLLNLSARRVGSGSL